MKAALKSIWRWSFVKGYVLHALLVVILGTLIELLRHLHTSDGTGIILGLFTYLPLMILDYPIIDFLDLNNHSWGMHRILFLIGALGSPMWGAIFIMLAAIARGFRTP
jgi:hypothetical protein